MEETFYKKFAIWVQIIFIILQTLGCISSLGSVIYTYKTFKISKPIYLVAMLDSIVSFLGFLALYGATMTIGIITEKDPDYLKGKREIFQFSLILHKVYVFWEDHKNFESEGILLSNFFQFEFLDMRNLQEQVKKALF